MNKTGKVPHFDYDINESGLKSKIAEQEEKIKDLE